MSPAVDSLAVLNAIQILSDVVTNDAAASAY